MKLINELESFSDFKDFINKELTQKILDSNNLTDNNKSKWLPFIGKNYNSVSDKVLILGLSHYLIENTKWEKTLKTKTPNIISTLENGMGYDYCNENIGSINKKRFHRGLERIFFNISQPEVYSESFAEQRFRFWTSISFYQLIETPMIGTSTHKKSIEKKEMEGGLDKLIRLVNIIKPKHIVMLSKDYLYHQELAKQTKELNKERIYEGLPNGKEIRTCFFKNAGHEFTFSSIIHPSLYRYICHQNNLLEKTMPSFLNYLKNGN